jgi:hypothetical protein
VVGDDDSVDGVEESDDAPEPSSPLTLVGTVTTGCVVGGTVVVEGTMVVGGKVVVDSGSGIDSPMVADTVLATRC